MSTTINDAKHIHQYVLKMRRYFHQYPELSGMEEKTSMKIISELKSMKVEFEKVGDYSIIAFINRNKGTKRLAFRASMDALPIDETGAYPYKSKNSDISHMSGHDIDMAILLGVIKTLERRKKELKGEVCFIFEANDLSFDGAQEILNSGQLGDLDYIFTVHDLPSFDAGTLISRSGLILGGAEVLHIKWHGKSASVPFVHEAKDPIFVASTFASNIRSIIATNMGPSETALAVVTEFMSGGFHNIIPDYCELTLNIRYQNEETRKKVHKLIIDYIKTLEKQFKVTSEVSIVNNVEPVVNNHDAYLLSYESALKIVSPENISEYNPVFYCEAFSYYLKKYKGAFLAFGSKNKNSLDTNSRSFTNTYNPNENAFQYASAWCIQIALDYLNKK